MTKFKKILCIVVALVVVITAAGFGVSNYMEDKKLKEAVISDEELEAFYELISYQEPLFLRDDDFIRDAMYNKFGHVGYEVIGFSTYNFGLDGNYEKFDIVLGVNKYGVTDIYIVPYNNDVMLHEVYHCSLDGTAELVLSENN